MLRLFDLPAHILLIHLPLVLVPALGIGTIVVAFRRTWWRSGGIVLAAAAFVAATSTILAARSGEAFYDEIRGRIGNIADDHQTLGEQTTLLTIALFLATAAFVATQRIGSTRDRVVVHRSLMGVTVLLGILASAWMIRTGHEGATIVWDGVLD